MQNNQVEIYGGMNNMVQYGSKQINVLSLQTLLKLRSSCRDISICFICVPAHAEVEGNEVVDSLAKKSPKLNLGHLDVPLSRHEVNTIIKREVNMLWHKQWHTNSKGKVFFTRFGQKVGGAGAEGERVITRLKIGHTGLNHHLNI